MSVFEPKVVVSILRDSSIMQPGEREKFRTRWMQTVKGRVEKWKNLPTTKACSRPLVQLQWEAEVVEYVTLLWNATRSRNQKGTKTKVLGHDVPILGPRFIPPTYLHSQLRPGIVSISPETQYIKPINIIHLLYYPELARCPQCQSCDEIAWEGWTTTGPRELHGISYEESTLGLQLRCECCKRSRVASAPRSENDGDVVMAESVGEKESSTGSSSPGNSYCFALTSHLFWKGWDHWDIPETIPIFYKRCALTRELFNIVVELRPSTTSAGLAEHFKQLHLQEYHQRKWAYLKAIERQHVKSMGTARLSGFGSAPKPFSTPNDPQGYADRSISDEMITEVFLDFSGRTRQKESEVYLRSLPTRCGSMDSTFKSASKATITDSNCRRSKELRGGILTMINEKGEIVAWRLCQTKVNAEITELLTGVRHRHEVLGSPMPEMMVTDNCCQVRHAIESAMPETHCVLDVWHFIARYIAAILNSRKNVHRAAVAADITNAILKKRSVNGSGAEYWNKAEQEQKLEAAFAKWAEKGTVWSAAATQVHKEQLKHVQKGCLERCRQDILSDGSRIEGSHKGWNSLQRVQPSGITMLVALGHDFVLRRNVRVAYHSVTQDSLSLQAPFLTSTHGSHHVGLVAAIATLQNRLLNNGLLSGLESLPELMLIDSGETFGLTASDHTLSFGGLICIKEELNELNDTTATHMLEFEHNGTSDLALQASQPLFEELGIDLRLLDQPAGTANTTVVAKKRKLEVISLTDNDDVALAGTLPSGGTHVKDSCAGWGPPVETVPPISKLSQLETQPHTTSETKTSQPNHLDCYFRKTNPVITSNVDTLKPPSTVHDTPMGYHVPTSASASKSPSVSTSGALCSPSASRSLLLPHFHVNGLTRSQRMFSLATNVDPRSLTVKESNEFYLFMDMRAEFKWVSYEMTPRRWVEATADYNKRLVAKCGTSAVLKHPLALLRQLGELEPRLMNRIMKGDYKSKRNTEDFWRKHCDAIVLIKPEIERGTSKKARKAQTCSRCRTIMYPGSEGSSLNHKKGYCNDGVKQVSKADEVPPWPQPQGIFTAGKVFHPQVFYTTLQDIYERYCAPVVTAKLPDPPSATMDAIAFIRLLASRIRTFDDGSIGFKLLADYELNPVTPAGYIIRPEDNSGDFLRLTYLQGSAN